MATRFNNANPTAQFKKGDIVTVKVPKKDRSRPTAPRILFIRVVRRKGKAAYKLQTKYGVLR